MESKPVAESHQHIHQEWPRIVPAKIRELLEDNTVSSWVIGLGVAVLSWGFAFGPNPGGIDSSWGTGLTLALDQGLRFGRDVVFTYGPLGFLRLGFGSAGVVETHLSVISWLYQGALLILLCIGLIELLRRSTGPWIAAALCLLVLSLAPSFIIETPILLATVGSMLALRKNPSANSVSLLAYGGALLAGIELFIKLSTGPLVLLIILLGLVGASASRRQLARFGLSFLSVMVVLFVLTGQNVADIPQLIHYSLEISSGYREAMTINLLPEGYAIAAGLLAVAVVVNTYFGDFEGTGRRWFALAIVIAVELVILKHATWRYESAHLIPGVVTLLLLWLSIPRRPVQVRLFLSISMPLIFVGVYVVSGAGGAINLNLVGNAGKFVQGSTTLMSAPALEAKQVAGRSSLREAYGLDSELLSTLKGKRVLTGPSEISMSWAYDLEWSPVPVFQDYSAYTKELDLLNASVISNSGGPERIVRPLRTPETWFSQTPDGRMPAWDPPAQQREILCHFSTIARSERWEVLGRVRNRCGEMELMGMVSASPGEAVEVPKPGRDAVTVLRLDGVGIEGLEKVWGTLLRPRSRSITIDGQEARTYRLVPDTATNGLMVRAGRGVEGSDGLVIPQAHTLSVDGVTRMLTFRFYRMPVLE